MTEAVTDIAQRPFAPVATAAARAASAAGIAAPTVSASIIAATDVQDSDWQAWDALCDNAGQANVFARSWMLRPALAHCGAPAPISILIVLRADQPIGMCALTVTNRLG
ncbi:MAG: hypothetical protein ACKOPG_09715, partial [Novosphingobium sp.]